MKPFSIHIYGADRIFYEGDCESVSVPAVDGQYGILANHPNLITAIVPGTLYFRLPGEELRKAAVSGGIMKVEDSDVLILVDSVLWPEEIDERRARAAADAAKEAMLQKRSRQEYLLAQAQLARAVSRLRLKDSYEKGGRR